MDSTIVQIVLAAIAVIIPGISIFIEGQQYAFDWTRTVPSSFIPRFLLPPPVSNTFDNLDALEYAYNLDESLLSSLDRFATTEITHPLANVFSSLYDAPLANLFSSLYDAPLANVVHDLYDSTLANVVHDFYDATLANVFRDLYDAPLANAFHDLYDAWTPEHPSFGVAARYTLLGFSLVVTILLCRAVLNVLNISIRRSPSSDVDQALSSVIEVPSIVISPSESLEHTPSFNSSGLFCTTGPNASGSCPVPLAKVDSILPPSLSEHNITDAPSPVLAHMPLNPQLAGIQSPELEDMVFADPDTLTPTFAFGIPTPMSPEVPSPDIHSHMILASDNWNSSEDGSFTSGSDQDSDADVSAQSEDLGRELDLANSGSGSCDTVPALALVPWIVPVMPTQEPSCSTAEDNFIAEADLSAVHSPVIELVSPQAVVEDDLLDFDSDLYEAPFDFPMMHLDDNLGDYLDDDVDDWGWTLINVYLHESGRFVYPGNISPFDADGRKNSPYIETNAYILDDAVPNLYFYDVLDADSRDHRRARSEPSSSSLLFITRADVEPVPNLDGDELMSRFTDVALRLGIIPHDRAFRLYEPTEELALDIRQEKRALVVSRPRLKKGKTALYIRKFGLDREEFFAIFQRPLTASFTSYADALRINGRLSRGLTITVRPEQVAQAAQRERSATVSAKSFVSLNRNRGGQDQNFNGDELIARKPVVRRDASCVPRQRSRTQSVPRLDSWKSQAKTADCPSPSPSPSVEQGRMRSRTRSGSVQSNGLQSNAADHTDAPRLRLRTSSTGPDPSLLAVRCAAATAAAASPPGLLADAPPPPAPPRSLRRRESVSCIARPPALATIPDSPPPAPQAVRVHETSPLLRHAGTETSLGVRRLVLPATSFARVDDEGAFDDVPEKTVDGKAVRENADSARVPSWVSM